MQKFSFKALSDGAKTLAGSRDFRYGVFGVIILVAISLAFFATSLGDTLQQSDTMQGVATDRRQRPILSRPAKRRAGPTRCLAVCLRFKSRRRMQVRNS